LWFDDLCGTPSVECRRSGGPAGNTHGVPPKRIPGGGGGGSATDIPCVDDVPPATRLGVVVVADVVQEVEEPVLAVPFADEDIERVVAVDVGRQQDPVRGQPLPREFELEQHTRGRNLGVVPVEVDGTDRGEEFDEPSLAPTGGELPAVPQVVGHDPAGFVPGRNDDAPGFRTGGSPSFVQRLGRSGAVVVSRGAQLP
jgi:hypothetical protein